jgi:flagellar basal body-associated protein FliL
MSIQNDVEKLYRSDLEKQRQKQKKKKKKKLLGIMLIVIIIAALILIMQYLGLGLGGKGEGSGDGKDVSASSNEASVTTTTTAVPKEFYDIKVSGSTYIIDERVVDLKSLVSTVKLMSDNVIVRITDDNATKNAMDDLKKALTDDGREFTETVLDNSALDNSMADTTSEAVR